MPQTIIYQQPISPQSSQQPQVIYQSQPQSIASGAQSAQIIYLNAQGQPIQSPLPQHQQHQHHQHHHHHQIIYVNAQGQPIQVQPHGTQLIIQQPAKGAMQMQPVITTTTIVNNTIIDDDPSCLYVFAVFGIILWLVGAIGMCVYNCGNGLGPKRIRAFRVLCVCTLLGFIWNVVLFIRGYYV